MAAGRDGLFRHTALAQVLARRPWATVAAVEGASWSYVWGFAGTFDLIGELPSRLPTMNCPDTQPV